MLVSECSSIVAKVEEGARNVCLLEAWQTSNAWPVHRRLPRKPSSPNLMRSQRQKIEM